MQAPCPRECSTPVAEQMERRQSHPAAGHHKQTAVRPTRSGRGGRPGATCAAGDVFHMVISQRLETPINAIPLSSTAA